MLPRLTHAEERYVAGLLGAMLYRNDLAWPGIAGSIREKLSKRIDSRVKRRRARRRKGRS